AMLDEVGIGAERRLPLRKFSKGMLQRVGIAQALINEPEVVFLDEPMSGLDPLGRREIRQLILRLRDRGCTVFFSSHVLADAETLCSRVAILARGRLAAAGRLSDMVAFKVRGWELVVTGVTEEAVKETLERGHVTSMTRLAEGRYALDLPLTPPPEETTAALIARGATLVSLMPVRDTLEDFFVRQVSEAPGSLRAGAPGPRHAGGLLRPAGERGYGLAPFGDRVRAIGHVAVNVFKESVR